jgi:hypothetical protein
MRDFLLAVASKSASDSKRSLIAAAKIIPHTAKIDLSILKHSQTKDGAVE